MYAKNTIDAARKTPLQPNSPLAPVGGGMNGRQLGMYVGSCRRMMKPPTTMKAIKTVTLIATIAFLHFALSETPITSSVARAVQTRKAGRLNRYVPGTRFTS